MELKKMVVLSAAGLFLLAGCTHSRPDGWYRSENENEVTGKAFVTVGDFRHIRVDSLADRGSAQYEIIVRLTPEGAAKFADATEENTGKFIAFLYRGKVITRPMVNMRIDGGSFSIRPHLHDREKTLEVYHGLKAQMEPATESREIPTAEEMARFDSLFIQLKKGWQTELAFSSNTHDIRKMPEYASLQEMGPTIIPLVVTRLSEGDFFVLPLYEELQDDENLLPPPEGSEQLRAKEAVTRYIEFKLGRKRRTFASEREKIDALKMLFEQHGWETEEGLTPQQQDSMLLRMDYEIMEDMVMMFAGEKE